MADTNIDLTRMNNERQELHILSLEQFSVIGTTLSNHTNMDNAKLVTGIGTQLTDLRFANQLIRELGLTGKAVIKEVHGQSYVILKGHPGLREKLTGTRYLASNPKVIDLAIGQKRVTSAMVTGARLSIFISVPMTVLQFLIDEQSTLLRLVGTMASDLVKISLSAVVASAAGMVAGTLTTVAAGPIVAAIAFGIATALTLEYLDRTFGVTNALVNALESAKERTFGELARRIVRFERNLINDAVRRMQFR
ncbi:hypothetical protein [Arsukibacterium sp.]|uniref:hypothetical protein n=1 Tax=Arsukibacterium sp. TaxID=1977258 RepID=UPI001BD6DC99|nr:hypothetical protein [Arsukibacterium sp.]